MSKEGLLVNCWTSERRTFLISIEAWDPFLESPRIFSGPQSEF